jgi:GR25 family glycosyltransferase involved in LPS biosynthesis
MKTYVITITDNEFSKSAADRCVASAKNFGIECEYFEAITPKHDPEAIAKKKNIPTHAFNNVYSRYLNCLSAFLSHYSLWERSFKTSSEILILEHDAVFVDKIPDVSFDRLISIGKPSYGKFNTGKFLGVNPLFSKPYLPGAHAYIIKPSGAAELIIKSKSDSGPTDVFLNLNNFPWLQEYYPWPVEVRDSFTTIQKEQGCIAKHTYDKEKYFIV